MDILHPPQWAMALAGWEAVLLVIWLGLRVLTSAIKRL
jgi:hypothetical protein